MIKNTERFITRIIIFFFLPVCVFLYLHSIIGTALMQQFLESTFYVGDSWWLHLIVGAGMTFFGAWILKKTRDSNRKLSHLYFLLLVCNILVFTVMSIYVWSVKWQPVDDQLAVYQVAGQFIAGDYTPWDKGGYMDKCPNQTGMVLLISILMKLSGENAYLWIQQFNIICFLAGGFFLYRITRSILGGRGTAGITMLLYLGFLPFGAYVTFIYGTMWGFAAAMAGFCYLLEYLELGGAGRLAGAVLCAGAACISKNNYLVVLIAMLCLCAAQGLVRRKGRPFFAAAVLCLGVWISFALLNLTVSTVTGRETSGGIPPSGYIAMGLKEGGRAPGWFNDYNMQVYIGSDYDTALADKRAKQEIVTRLQDFLSQPAYMLEFFSKKTASQWNNPTFQGFWIQQTKSFTREDIPDVVNELILDGKPANRILTGILDLEQSLILLGVLFYLFFVRDKDIKQLSLAVPFLGGFLFHLFWEAKGQYTVVYFVLLLPYSVAGFRAACRKLSGCLGTKTFRMVSGRLAAGIVCGLLVVLLCVTQRSILFSKLINYYDDQTDYEEYLVDRALLYP